MVYVPNTISAENQHELVGVGGQLMIPPIAQPPINTDLQSSIGEIGDFVNPAFTSNQQDETVAVTSDHQFTNSTAETGYQQELDPVGDTTNSPPIAPTAQELAAVILQCATWVELVQGIGENGSSLLAAAKTMPQEQRPRLTHLLATHLCQDLTYLKKLSWVPVKLRNKALAQLKFTIRQIGGVANSVSDACVEYVRGCKFVTVANLGTRYEQWVFQTQEGVRLPVFGVEEIQAIAFNAN